MAYVTITKDLTEVKDKVAFGLTKRQIGLLFPGRDCRRGNLLPDPALPG